MKVVIFLLIAALVLLSSCNVQMNVTATIVESEGRVTIERDSELIPAGVNTELEDGDVVTAGEDSTAVIVKSTGERITLSNAESYTFSSAPTS